MKENHFWINGFAEDNKDNDKSEIYKKFSELCYEYLHAGMDYRLKLLHKKLKKFKF